MDTARLIGKQIDQYYIVRHIDRGGMADVYLAEDVTLKRKVAFKVMLDVLAVDPQFVARFEREAQTVAQLDHPNIIQVYSTGLTPLGQPYIAMQYIDGGSLSDKLKTLGERGKLLTTEQALNITRQVALALSVAHNARIVHRDLKPANVLTRPDGTPVLVDLGIAAVSDQSKLTMTGGIIGTPQYMSPEQVRGKALDGRSDIYSLGIILYEMLAGIRPFEGDESIAVMHQQVYEQPPPLHKRRPDLSPQTVSIVETCLQKEPAHRFQSAEEMIQAIDRALLADEGHGPNPQLTQVLTYLPDSALISRQQVVHESTMTRPRFHIPIPPWVIATLLVMIVGVVAFVLMNRLDDFGSQTALATAELDSPTPEAIVVFVTAIVTETPDQTATAVADDSANTNLSVVDTADASTPTTIANPTSTIAPSPPIMLTDTPPPADTPAPTHASLPTPTFLPTATPLPAAIPCTVAVYSSFTSVWNSHDEVLGCSSAPGKGGVWMAEESFQNGRMFWRQDNRRIYVLYNSGNWASYNDTWNESLPEYSCGTPQSPPTPKRGFGKVWCEHNTVHQGLGNATSEESGANGAVQDYVGGLILQTGSGHIYIFYNNGSWR